ncbi:hypothetical protein [Bacillus wiedmannii]|uniref:hypothetical protein n=1 Tax=Bacillus wiedmannii TaxID=1890302 RepID=UPI000BF04871|nr:hypothetical protein [Bacillus wiedmannii]PEN61662.1 hypothetical protein CN576_21775 [Bacillus wiedmannii]PHA62906.1 hypothetical protein COE75_16875 [Bacillus wiedmannii]
MDLKKRFASELKAIGTPEVITVATRLPSGNIRVTTVTENTVAEANYYLEFYDDNFRAKNNENVQILGYMLI